MCLFARTRALSRRHSDLEVELWRECDVPFLRDAPFFHRLRVLWCELVQRHFLADVVRHVRVTTRRHACIAGGYAAWRWYRSLDVQYGGDGYPRTLRASQVWDGYLRRQEWIPSHISLFVEAHGGDEDDAVVLDVVRACYEQFCVRLYHDVRCFTVTGPVDSRCGETDVTDAHLTECLDELEFGQDVRGLCRDQMTLDRFIERDGTTPVFLRVVTLHITRSEFLVPTRLRVVFTKSETPFVPHLLSSFCLPHCKLACEVDSSNGQYRFQGDALGAEMLAQRRLCISDGALVRSREELRLILQRMRRYVERGFSVRGDRRVFRTMPKNSIECVQLCPTRTLDGEHECDASNR